MKIAKILLGTTTTIALMLVSVPMANAAVVPPPAQTYSDAELFEGLLLNNGPLADEHPEVLLDPALAGTIDDEAAEAILTLIDQQHPQAFSDFEAAITSSDPYVVRAGLYDGRDLLVELLAPIAPSPGTVTPMADTICSLTACAVTFVAIAFFIVAVVAVKGKSASAFGKAETSSQTLELDEWVARIIQQLG